MTLMVWKFLPQVLIAASAANIFGTLNLGLLEVIGKMLSAFLLGQIQIGSAR